MDFLYALSGVGSVLAGLAAWAALASPRARDNRRARQDSAQRQLEIHSALYGTKERLDESGALIAEGQPGLIADMRTVLALPILNGKGTAALAEISSLGDSIGRIDRRTQRLGQQLAQHLRQHEQAVK